MKTPVAKCTTNPPRVPPALGLLMHPRTPRMFPHRAAHLGSLRAISLREPNPSSTLVTGSNC